MGAPNSFGTAVNNMGMQQPAMVNQVSNNMMNSMAPMGAAPQTTMSMGMQPQAGFGGVPPMGSAPAAAPMNVGAMAPMSPGAGMMAPATPTSSVNNAANAM